MECTNYGFQPVLPEWGRIFLHVESVIECWPPPACYSLTTPPSHQPNWSMQYSHSSYAIIHMRSIGRTSTDRSKTICNIWSFWGLVEQGLLLTDHSQATNLTGACNTHTLLYHRESTFTDQPQILFAILQWMIHDVCRETLVDCPTQFMCTWIFICCVPWQS